MQKFLKKLKHKLIIFIVSGLLAGIFIAYLIADISQKWTEKKYSYVKVVEITDETEDPADWGKNFPLQYETYKQTVDMKRTKYGGSEAIPVSPKESDTRTVISKSKLEEDQRFIIMWSGYAFSKDYREDRGHAYMHIDAMFTGRQQVVTQPGTCLNCHSSVYPVMKKLGEGDLMKGFHIFNAMKFSEAKELIKHPVACIDCHNPVDMSLRVTRPALIEGLKVWKQKQGIQNYDVNRDATRQEMRTYVCAQCHVEYYFKGQEKTLTFPWHEGIKADEILKYYDSIKFKDWVHKLTGAEVLKAQHPEFELFSQGIHAKSGVTCADCHMPYKREGNVKFSNHHVKSPYLDVRASCGTCHNLSEEELKKRIEEIQDRHWELREVAFQAVIDLIKDIEEAKKKGISDLELKQALEYQRKAQFYFDFIEAENSTGFHAPQESARVLGLAIDAARKGQVSIPR